MAAGIVLALWMSVNSSAFHPSAFNHVRSEEPRIRDLVADGYARSATFRALVDATEDLPCIVYIATTIKLSQGMSGALLHRTDGRREMPLLRVLVRTNLSRDETIAIIAHELQHVVEAMSGARGEGRSAVAAVFETLDTTGARGTRKYETEAAVDVTSKVRGELRRVRPFQREAGEPIGR
jgi:hypothetical protein